MEIIGSPEWFNSQSCTKELHILQDKLENRRYSFLEKFAPERLADMSGEELLDKVFNNNETSMIRLLMFDDNYRWFGAPGPYPYLGVVYQTENGQWKYKEGSNSIVLNRETAIEKAVYVRNMLLNCIKEIENTNLNSINGYNELAGKIKHIFFSQYAWVIKYYQMVFPYYFPGMYADKTINRAMKILGLPFFGNSNRLINCGQISLFIRKCDVNNIIFNEIYAKQWGWDRTYNPSPNAKENYKNCKIPVQKYNKHYYKLLTDKVDLNCEAEKIDNEISKLNLLGKEKEAIVKIRTNQGTFRERLMYRYDHCCLCGVKNSNLLIASHIKPWAESSASEKLDIENGLLLCPHHDKLFDLGYITFSDEGQIIISESLSETDRMFMNVNKTMKIELTESNKKYLKYHRENIYKN